VSIETLTGLLAEGDWRELIGPLVVFGIYAVATILKKAAGGKLDAAEEEDEDSVESSFSTEDASSSESPRYKPLDEAARPAAAEAQTPQQRTLPYARERQPQPSAAEQAELERQRRLRQLREEQIQIARRRRLAQQQAEQSAVRQRIAQPVQKADLRPTASAPSRKTPQEMLRQAQTGQPARGVERPSARPLRGEMSTTTTQSVSMSKPATAPAAGLQRLLRDRTSLRRAIVLKEILEKPLALR